LIHKNVDSFVLKLLANVEMIVK